MASPVSVGNYPVATGNAALSGGIFTKSGSDPIIANNAWNFCATPDRVNNVAVPANSVVYVTYRAHMDKTGGNNGIYTLLCAAPSGSLAANSAVVATFGNGNGGNWVDVESNAVFNGQAPSIAAVIATGSITNNNGAANYGIYEVGFSGAGDPSDVFQTAPQWMGTPLTLAMPAGTYDFGVAYYTDPTTTASRSNPWLCVDVRTFA